MLINENKRLPTGIFTRTVLFSVKKERDKVWITSLKTHKHTNTDLNNRKVKFKMSNIQY